MMCILDLYLKDVYIKSEEIFLSDNKDELSMEYNFKIREVQLKAAAETLKLQHVRALIKCEQQYMIVATIKSIKFDYYDADGDIN